jgi:hypothetical protein
LTIHLAAKVPFIVRLSFFKYAWLFSDQLLTQSWTLNPLFDLKKSRIRVSSNFIKKTNSFYSFFFLYFCKNSLIFGGFFTHTFNSSCKYFWLNFIEWPMKSLKISFRLLFLYCNKFKSKNWSFILPFPGYIKLAYKSIFHSLWLDN